MGKAEVEQPLPVSVTDEARIAENGGIHNGLRKFLSFRCVFVLLFGLAVFISAVFWLPFFHLRDHNGRDLDSEYGGHAMVARFMVNKPVSILDDNKLQLEDDIFSIISFSNTKVDILTLESTVGSNATQVIFAVDSDTTSKSLIRDAFVSLIINQTPFQLTTSLFGDPFDFEVLKFIGGLTISPQQNAFLMQKVQILFNFTLNFSIQQLIDNFEQLREELKSGLHLAAYENLYISLINEKGSTVSPPTTVKCQVLLAVGIKPSTSRFKQLAQTISSPHDQNLGLNNSIFGKVKQVRLSSILQSSLGSPSPSPTPHFHHHHHHHNHHHHHHHHHEHHKDSGIAPSNSPSPRAENTRPRHGMFHKAKSPGCEFDNENRFPRNSNPGLRLSPVSSLDLGRKVSPAPDYHRRDKHIHVEHSVPVSSPLSSVILSGVRPQSKKDFNAMPPGFAPAVSPSVSSSFAGKTSNTLWAYFLWCIFLILNL